MGKSGYKNKKKVAQTKADRMLKMAIKNAGQNCGVREITRVMRKK